MKILRAGGIGKKGLSPSRRPSRCGRMTDASDPAYREWAQVTLPPRLDAVPEAIEPLRRYLATRGASDDEIDAVRLAITEALTNAVRHSGVAARGDRVHLNWSWHEEWLDVRISEPGQFDPPPDWTDLPDDPLAESGRGGFLIRTLMDDAVHQNGRGFHTLCLRKRLRRPSRPAKPPPDLERTLADMTEDLSFSYEALSALFRLAEALATSEDFEAFAQHALDLRQLTDADAIEIRLTDDSGRLALVASAGQLASDEPIAADSAALYAEAFRTGLERAIENRAALPASDLLHADAGCAFVYPIGFHERHWGVCAITRQRSGPFFTAGQLSIARTMADFLGIARANVEIQRQRQAQLQAQREVEIAAHIQESLLPKEFPVRDDWRIHGRCVNARDVGGDFFDVMETPEGILLVIADVMGKGVPAALLALVMRTAVRSHPGLASHPGRLLTTINAQLTPDLDRVGMFITAQMVYLERGGARFSYASAGHCPMLLLSPDDTEPAVLARGGTPLGVVDTEEYEEYSRTVARGQRLLMLTDGITETANARAQMLGVEAAGRMAMRFAAQPLATASSNLLSAVHGFGNARAATDDRTIMMVEALIGHS